MLQPTVLFECVQSILIPRLPLAPDGTIRVPDGQRLLSLEQAAGQFHVEPHVLADAYERYLADSLTPEDAGRLADPATYAAGAEQLRQTIAHSALHRLKFPHLTPEHFDLLLVECRERGFDPWSREIWAAVRPNPHTQIPELSIETTVEALRARAERHPAYAGQVGPLWCGPDGKWMEVWTRPEPPVAAKVGINRTDRPDTQFRIAHFAEFAQYVMGPRGQKVLNDFWEKMPAHMLAKVCEALALRAAFRDTLSGLYTRDEMPPASSPSPQPSPGLHDAARSAAGDEMDPPAAACEQLASYDDDYPTTRFRFELALLDLGFNEAGKRQRVIAEFKDAHRLLYMRDPAAFYRLVIQAVRLNPGRYGLPSPEPQRLVSQE